MPKKKFIDKKKSVSFHLVHRSQQDPLIVEENAPQHVIVEQKKKNNQEERHQYGIYFDDDYDYMQHLRSSFDEKKLELVNDGEIEKCKPKLQLPSSVFASQIEESVGLLNKAAPHYGPRPDLDPDILEALDDSFDFDNPENILEDNFIELAEGEASEKDSDEEYDQDDDNLSVFSFNEVETKSRFTEYSLSSSVVHRNKQLALLDEKFEKAFAGYDVANVGALEGDEIEGFLPDNCDILVNYAQKFIQEKKEKCNIFDNNLHLTDIQEETSDSDHDDDYVVKVVKEDKEWDCESILTNNTSHFNLPAVIRELPSQKIKINKITGIPEDVFVSNKLTVRNLKQLNELNNQNNKLETNRTTKSVISTLSALSFRPKNESTQERKERKKKLKEIRRERRIDKKNNKEAFKEESKRQQQLAHYNTKVVGNKILL